MLSVPLAAGYAVQSVRLQQALREIIQTAEQSSFKAVSLNAEAMVKARELLREIEEAE